MSLTPTLSGSTPNRTVGQIQSNPLHSLANEIIERLSNLINSHSMLVEQLYSPRPRPVPSSSGPPEHSPPSPGDALETKLHRALRQIGDLEDRTSELGGN
jgi:hypothetical protein